jgi:hypothetical protein
VRQIAQLGTFDVENYGDLLYPLSFSRLLAFTIHHYSLLPGAAPCEAGFSTHAIGSLFSATADKPLTLLVGGGDLLRTDSDVIARHYGRNSRATSQAVRRSIGLRGYAGYLLHDRLPRLDPANFYASSFRARWMNYPAVGPFIIDPRALPPQSVVAYASCGVPHDFNAVEAEDVKRALDRSAYLWVRDEQSAEKLRRAGISQQLHVAPDLAVVLSDHFKREELVRRGREILSRLEVDVDRPIVCFQSQPYPGFSEAEIVTQLSDYAARSGAEIVLLPLAYCHGDHEFLRGLWQRAPTRLKYADVYSVFDMMAIIAGSDLFIGTSLHGNITAFSFGIPHLFGPLPVAKTEGFLDVAGLPRQLKLQSWSELNNKIELACDLGDEFFASRARDAKAAVYREVDQLLPDLVKCANT